VIDLGGYPRWAVLTLRIGCDWALEDYRDLIRGNQQIFHHPSKVVLDSEREQQIAAAQTLPKFEPCATHREGIAAAIPETK
jgi:hypothetical protein